MFQLVFLVRWIIPLGINIIINVIETLIHLYSVNYPLETLSSIHNYDLRSIHIENVVTRLELLFYWISTNQEISYYKLYLSGIIPLALNIFSIIMFVFGGFKSLRIFDVT